MASCSNGAIDKDATMLASSSTSLEQSDVDGPF